MKKRVKIKELRKLSEIDFNDINEDEDDINVHTIENLNGDEIKLYDDYGNSKYYVVSNNNIIAEGEYGGAGFVSAKIQDPEAILDLISSMVNIIE